LPLPGGPAGLFLFLHTYAPHAPYTPPEPYQELFWKGEPPPGARPSDRELTELNLRGVRLPEEVLAWYVALYDATIRYADDVLADFFAEFAALGLDDETTIVITSDHGEEFQEHGRLAHTQLYHETFHVPLILVHPDLSSGGERAAGGRSPRAQRWPGLAESVDLAPILYALSGIEPRTAPSGRDLLRVRDDPVCAADSRRATSERGRKRAPSCGPSTRGGARACCT
jgi:arylsulfatase A-like enzyme